jgi:Tol biopolymer transport system component
MNLSARHSVRLTAAAPAWLILAACSTGLACLQDVPQLAVYVAHADGTAAKKLVQVPNHRWHGSPAWSPDGKSIMFWIASDDGSRRFHVVDPDTDDPPVVLKDQEGAGFISDQAYSPDSSKVAFVSDRG